MSEIDVSQIPEVRQMIESFVSYTNIRWFEKSERNAIFGIILALGGVLAERKSKTILLTLGLPVQRRNWILFQFSIVMLFLLALNLLAIPSLIAGGYLFNQPIPVPACFIRCIYVDTYRCSFYWNDNFFHFY